MKFGRPNRGSGANMTTKRIGDNAPIAKRRRRNNNTTSCEDDGTDLTATTARTVVSATSTKATTLRPSTAVKASETQQRRRFQRRARQLAMAVCGSTVLLIVTAIPASVLMCLALLMSCWAGLAYTLYRRLAFEYRAAVLNGDGLGRMLLPDSLYDQLVNQSLHEWLSRNEETVSNTANEYRFLAMYFMPGLNQDTINRHVSRLYPRHQRFLNQPGMARHIPVVGNGLMRVLIGQNRYDMLQSASPGQVVPPALPVDDDSSLDSITSAPDEGNNRTRSLPRTIDTIQRATSEPERDSCGIEYEEDKDVISIHDDIDDHEGEPEESIVADAISDAITGVKNMATNFAVSTSRFVAVQGTRLIARQLQRIGTATTMASMSVGMIGFGLGVYRPNQRFTSSSLPSIAAYFPSGTFLVSTFLASGLTAGIVRNMLGDNAKPMIKAKGKRNDGKKD